VLGAQQSGSVAPPLAKAIATCAADPLKFALLAFPWGKKDLIHYDGPKAWQAKILKSIGAHLQNPETRFTTKRIAVASGKGIGKSAFIGMLGNWAMSTCPDCRIVITANTGGQLSTKTAPETQKWYKLAINKHWWDVAATSISSRVREHGKLWRTDFIPWSANNPEAFAGLHNEGKRIVFIMDEASAIDDVIWKTAEGFFTDSHTEMIWLAFGNPTLNTGAFFECFGKYAHRWETHRIDSREVEGTNKAEIEKWVADEGEDSDFVRIWVRGEFPRFGSFQFISSESVERCRKYRAEAFDHLPKIMVCDVARFGEDQSVIGVRQGRKFRVLEKHRGWDVVQTATKIIEHCELERPDAVVVDGDGIGAGVVDTLKHRGYDKNLIEFHGNATPDDVNKYYNKRAEVWGLMKDALAAGMEIPDDPELADQLTSIRYSYSNDQKIQLEKKESLKLRGYSSPDLGDALAYSFAVQLLAARPEAKAFTENLIKPYLGWDQGRHDQGWMR
jgi:hypothetical protein